LTIFLFLLFLGQLLGYCGRIAVLVVLRVMLGFGLQPSLALRG
jgi:hypothetical protein